MGEQPPLDASIWEPQSALRNSAQGGLRKDVTGDAPASVARMALVAAGITLVLLIISVLSFGPRVGIVASLGFSCAVSIGASLLLRVGGLDPRGVTALAVAYLWLLCLGLGAYRHLQPFAVFDALSIVSLGAPAILAFAALVPLLPTKAFLSALGAALMDPLSLVLTGAQTSPGALFGSIGIAIVLSWIAKEVSSAVHRLSEGIKRAQRVGSYHLVQRLGRGAMAEVWRAEHRMLARPAAIKLIRPGIVEQNGPIEGQRLLRLFLREARTTAKLSSPHTIVLYDFGISREGAFYQVMELLDGWDLQTLVEQFGPLPSERVAHLLSQVCLSLREAHQAQFVHRDVKPANIFSCSLGGEYDHVKVLDFGLVLDRHPTSDEIEDEQRFVGTPAIMAPEMLRYKVPVDARADIYALGCVGYWLLSGKRVFEATTRADMLVMHAHQRPVAPSKRADRVAHSGLEAVVMQCLEKNPNKRPQTAQELLDQLLELTFQHPWDAERRVAWWAKARRASARSVESDGGGEGWLQPEQR